MKHKLGLSLSGGSVKGAFQAGALLALEEKGILDQVEMSVGTSVGAINSFAIAHISAKELCDLYLSLRKRSDLFSPTWWKIWAPKGLYSLKPTQEFISKKLKIAGSPKRKSFACCVNLDDAEVRYVDYDSMPSQVFLKWVMASSCIPFYMEPVLGNWFDGGVKETAPLDFAVERCDKVICIVTTPIRDKIHSKFDPKWPQLLSYGFRTIDEVMGHESYMNDIEYYTQNPENCEITMIAPDEVIDVGTFEVKPSKIKKMIEMGYNKAKEVIEKVEV